MHSWSSQHQQPFLAPQSISILMYTTCTLGSADQVGNGRIHWLAQLVGERWWEQEKQAVFSATSFLRLDCWWLHPSCLVSTESRIRCVFFSAVPSLGTQLNKDPYCTNPINSSVTRHRGAWNRRNSEGSQVTGPTDKTARSEQNWGSNLKIE